MRRPVVIEIGAGTAISTVRHFSTRVVRQHGGSLIRVNMREPVVADAQGVGLTLTALDALQAIGLYL